ncbi:MAG TPA: CorA family divalent cation transporter [Caulobacterales bacterium]|nr:CorA family divalent cation transporter [Caulobacterales bacterium]
MIASLEYPDVLWLFGFDEHGLRARDPTPQALEPPAGGWLWLHLPLSDNRTRIFVDRLSAMPAAARETLLGPEQAPRFSWEDGWAFGLLSDFERDLGGQPTVPGRLRFAFNDRMLVTVRRHALFSPDQVRHAIGRREAIASPVDALEALCDHYGAAVRIKLDSIGMDLDRVEDHILDGALGPEAMKLGPARRESSRHHREMIAFRSAFQPLAQRREKRCPSALYDAGQRIVQKLDEIDRDAASLLDRGRLLHDEIDTLTNSATNRSLRALTVISTLLLPPTVIVGAFGMNLKGIPYADSVFGFAAASGWCAASVAAACLILWRLGVFD